MWENPQHSSQMSLLGNPERDNRPDPNSESRSSSVGNSYCQPYNVNDLRADGLLTNEANWTRATTQMQPFFHPETTSRHQQSALQGIVGSQHRVEAAGSQPNFNPPPIAPATPAIPGPPFSYGGPIMHGASPSSIPDVVQTSLQMADREPTFGFDAYDGIASEHGMYGCANCASGICLEHTHLHNLDWNGSRGGGV